MPISRIARVNKLLLQQISAIIQRELSLPEGAFVTVESVDTSPDLQHAKVLVSIFPDNRQASVRALLDHHIYDIQKIVDKRLHMRPVPKIRFMTAGRNAAEGRVEELLGKIKRGENEELQHNGVVAE